MGSTILDHIENGEHTMRTKEGINTYRTTAKVVGIVWLAGFILAVVGNRLILSILGTPNPLSAVAANSMQVAIGGMLMLICAAAEVALGVLMFPVLKRHSERIALGYFGSKILDAVFFAVWVIFLLIQIPLATEYLETAALDTSYLQGLSTVFIQMSQYAYQISQIAVVLAGFLLCYIFFKTKLVPRWVAVWGLAGYAVLLGGSVLEILGFDLQLVQTIPGGLWELFICVWLIAKGFNSSAFGSESTTTGITHDAAVGVSAA
jgi:hypothetical protein